MPILTVALPTIPVGVCILVLTVIGAVLSVLEFRGWRRVVLVAVFVLLGLGEYVGIRQADFAHQLEVGKLNDKLDVFQASEVRNAVDLAYLKAKLEDASKMNEQLSQFAPAIMKLAQTSAEFTRKQYENKAMSDHDLYALTSLAVKNIRDFSSKYRAMDEKLFNETTNKIRSGSRTQADMVRLSGEEAQSFSDLRLQRDSEFRNSILPDAIFARQEMLKRKLPEPNLSQMEQATVDMVLHTGMLAGPYPELALADYLEVMAKPLSLK